MSKQQKIIALLAGVLFILLVLIAFKSWKNNQSKIVNPTTNEVEKVYTYKNEDKGLIIDFTDPYTKVDDNTVMFGHYIKTAASDKQVRAYKLTIAPNKAAKNILADYVISSTTVMMPELFINNGLQTLRYSEKNICELRTIEVVGQTYNYIFSSDGCKTDSETDFAYLEKTISKIKILSPINSVVNKNNIYYRNDQFGFGLGYIPTDWANYIIKKTDKGFAFGFLGKFETKDDVKDFVKAPDGEFQSILNLDIYTKDDYQKYVNNLGKDASKIKKIGENNFYVFAVATDLSGDPADGDFLGRRRAEAEAVVIEFKTFDAKKLFNNKIPTTTPAVKK